MSIYFNGIELIAVFIAVFCSLFLLFCKWADRYYNTHHNWISKFLAKLFGIKE